MTIKRNIEKRFKEAISTSPAVLLTGARQTGKTTLVEEYAKNKGYQYITFDDLAFLSAATRDPQGFIAGLAKPVIIDEVQRVPDIFFPIKRDIDLNREPGRYILTGSANPLLINRTGELLVGRLETLTLFPLSQGELQGRKETFIEKSFSAENPGKTKKKTLSKEELYNHIVIGGYPVVQNLSESQRQAWFEGYVNDLLLKDVQNLARIEGLAELPNLLKFVSFRAGHVLNVTDVGRLLGMSAASTHRYITLLETFFIISFCRPWRASLEKRFVKSPRVYLIDTGILTFLQGITSERLMADPILSGHVLENFVWQELSKQASWSSLHVEILHFRMASGTEVDIVLEDRMGRVVGIEVKNSDTIRGDDFKGLVYLQEMLGEKFVQGIVFYTGDQVVPFGQKLFAVPFSYLWQM